MAVFCLSIAAAPKASAKGLIIYSNGEELKTLHELPEEAKMDDGTHVNLGVHYESFSLFWMPVWNYGEYKYALVNDAEDTWYELSEEELKALATEYKLDLPATPELPLLTQIGLKPVIIIVVLFFIVSYFLPNEEEEEPVNEETPQSEN